MERVLTGLRPYTPSDLENLTSLVTEARAFPPTGSFAVDDLLARWERWHVDPAHDINVLPGPDGRLIASVGRDNSAVIWNASNGQLVAKLQPSPFINIGNIHINIAGLNVAIFSPDSQRIITSGVSSPQVWRLISFSDIDDLLR